MRFITRTIAAATVALGLSAPTANASHLMGGDLYYKHLGGLDYEVTLVVYRDCYGIPVNPVETVNIVSVNCGFAIPMTMDTIGMTTIESGCAGMLSTCSGGSAPGAEIYAYRDTVTLPMACSDWVFSWTNCCRNAAITNLMTPDNFGFYAEAHLDNLNFAGNSSPVFQEIQLPFICDSVQFCLDNGAYDADGDSLVYSMINPADAGNVPIAFAAPYSVADPFPTVSGHVFDPVTGNHCATPSMIGAWVMAYKVEEYRNGQLIGSATRDVQLWTVPCPSATLGFEGTVTDTNGVAVSSGDVELYEYGLNVYGSGLVSSTPVDPLGHYSFSGITNGQYIVRAVPDSVNYPNTATTYHVNTHYWTYAEVLSSVCDSTIHADIQLTGFGNLTGSGVVDGYLGDLGIVRSEFGTPWEGQGVILENWPGGDLLTFTRTNADGNYHFGHVPDGTYRIMVDHPGLPMLGYYVITIGGGTTTFSGMDYGAEAEGISPYSVTGLHGHQDAVLQHVVPNPSNAASVTVTGVPEGVQDVVFYDASGRSLRTVRVKSSAGVITLDTSGLAAGTYHIRVGASGAMLKLMRF